MANLNIPNTKDRTLDAFKGRMVGGGARPNLFECELYFPDDAIPLDASKDEISDKTRFLVNDYCFKNKKILISGAISKFDGQVYTFNFNKKNSPCLRCFIPKMPNNPDVDNCEYDGVLGPLAGIIGSIQANEAVKEILKIGDTLCGYILVFNALKLNFRKIYVCKIVS